MTIPHGPLSSANFIQHMARNTSDKRMAQALTVMSVALIALMIYREGKGLLSDRPGHAERFHPHHDFEPRGRHSHVERLEAERGRQHGHSHGR